MAGVCIECCVHGAHKMKEAQSIASTDVVLCCESHVDDDHRDGQNSFEASVLTANSTISH